MALIQCPECGQNISGKAKTCVHCGVGVGICSECGNAYVEGAEICPSCGYSFGKAAEEEKVVEKKAVKNKQGRNDDKEIKEELRALQITWSKQSQVLNWSIKLSGIVAIIALGFVVALVVLLKLYSYLGIIALSVSFCAIGYIVIKEFMEKIFPEILTRMQVKSLKEKGREKYLSYIKNTYKKINYSEKEAELFHAISDRAMILEVSGEQAKRIIGAIINFTVNAGAMIFDTVVGLLIILLVIQGYGPWEAIVSILGFGQTSLAVVVLAGIIIIEIAGLTTAELTIESNSLKRCAKWLESLEETKEKTEEK